MANTTVTDAFFQSNVTMNVADGLRKTQTDGFSFEKVMSETTEKKQPMVETESDNTANRSLQVNKTHKNLDTDKSNESEQKIDEKVPEEVDKVAEKIVDKAETVKDKIKDVFEVTEEELVEVMTNLGIAVQDLIKPDDLKQVMMELSGVEDSMELLTNESIYSDMQEILKFDSEAVSQLTEELPITKEEIFSLTSDKELFDRVVNQMVVPETEELQIDEIPVTGTELPKSEEKVELQNADVVIDTQAVESGATIVNANNTDTAVNSKEDTTNKVENDAKDYSQVQENTGSDKVVVTNDKTESFKNVSATKKSDDNNSQNMASMNEVKTTVTINAEGNLVETVERFSEGFYDAREIVSQVTETIKMNISQDTTSMEMQLHPATLGTVNMQISSQNGVITAHLLVQNEAVKAALETQLLTLQETFEERGQQVEAIEVTVANYNLDRGMQNNADSQERENALRSGKNARKRLKLDEISEDEFEELDEEDKVTADMMRRQGNSVNFMA